MPENDDKPPNNDDTPPNSDDTRNTDDSFTSGDDELPSSSDENSTSGEDKRPSREDTPPSKQRRLILSTPLFFLSGNGVNDAIDDKWPPPSLPFILDPVQVLDIDLQVFWFHHDQHPGALDKISGFTNVTTVRRFGAHTASVIGKIPFGAPGMKCVDYLDTEGLCPNTAYDIQCIPGVASHVVHISWPPVRNTNVEFHFERTGDLEDVTLVLWPSYHFREENTDPTPSSEIWGILDSLEDAVQRGVSLTIVGAERIHLEHMTDEPLDDNDPSHEWMEPHEKLLQNFLFKLSSVWNCIPEYEMDAAMARVKCVTMHEWCSSLTAHELTFIAEPSDLY